MTNLVLAFVAGLIVGALILYLRARSRETIQRDAFKALAGDVLKDSVEQLANINRTVLDKQQQVASGELNRQKEAVAGLVKPIGESLEKVGREITALEKERARSHADLVRLMGTLDAAQNALRNETGNLVKALRRPEVKGRWGELQLKKVVEMAGMVDHVDFVEQASTESDAGRLRPDMIVRLPGGQQVVVDAKAPLDAYLEAAETEDEERKRGLLDDHARHIHDHMKKLGAKNYWREFAEAPEFVVMFLPGENIFGQALMQDPSLIEKGVDEKVIPASPTTLIALLRSVAYGWNQQRLAESAEKISNLGRDLHKRMRVLGEHFAKLGLNLGRSVDSYNQAVGSLERQVLPQARKFTELGAAAAGEIGELPPVDKAVRSLEAPELAPGGDDDPPAAAAQENSPRTRAKRRGAARGGRAASRFVRRCQSMICRMSSAWVVSSRMASLWVMISGIVRPSSLSDQSSQSPLTWLDGAPISSS